MEALGACLMQGLSSYVVTLTSTIRVNAYTADDAETAAREVLHRDGPDDVTVTRSEEEPSDRDYT